VTEQANLDGCSRIQADAGSDDTKTCAPIGIDAVAWTCIAAADVSLDGARFHPRYSPI
jgi:hypothetical protein